MLVLRVHDAAGVIQVLELDHVIPDVVGGPGELHAQRRIEPRAERLSTARLADLDVLREEPGEGVQVAHVERKRVPRGELTDLLERLEPLDAARQRCEIVGFGHGDKPRRRAAYAIRTTQMHNLVATLR